jgi:AAA+ ATPase superfamily predicted ATPase
MRIFERKKELQQIQKVLTSSKSEFLYLRGRRRVGKSWLLAELQKAQRASFLFTGQADASAKQTLKNMVQQWSIFSSTNALLYRASAFLNWQSVFEEMLHFAQSKQSKITLIFDEIQWIAKKNTGFIGALKTAWVSWQQSNLINVIVCGSSNKFFHDHVGGEEKILRGLQTAATLWVHPIELQRVREEFAPDWNFQEVALLYMMIGGVPYYLERVDTTLPFIHAVNGAFFTKARNLLNEPEELLGLEFNRLGRSNALRILAALGQAGSSQKNIAYKTGIEKSTVSKLVRSLTDYQLVFSRIPYQRSRYENEDFERYYMKDYFLN